ncbi:putative glycoside hydrolase [Acidimicrobiaceae bacterium]|nr:putative glycoside hydrolase [Acidimicrobiaceae bacterium]|tara:strand:- start:1667 stop:2956 length:1290 start_codon:yes stop_codon:yes gene_type:complete
MNRVIFFVAFILLLCVPFSVNFGNDESFSYLEIVKKLKDEIISIVIKTEITSPSELVFSEEDKVLFNKKYEEFKVAETLNSEYFFATYAEESIANNKNINKYLAKFKWLSLKEKEGGVKGIYLNGYDFTNKDKIQSITNILLKTEVNTVVLDVKTDNGHLLYNSGLPEVSELNNKRVKYDKDVLLKFKSDFNIYLIGRVVAFQDPTFAKKFENSSVINPETNSPFTQNGQYFLDPGDDKARDYVLNVAAEACSLGFDEIQFDYIRYPDTNTKGLIYEDENITKNRVENINSFLISSKDVLNGMGCLVSADIFGYVLQNKSDNGIGQHLETIVETVDFISPMVYPSHYSKGSFGYQYPNNFPYEVVSAALNDGLKRGIEKEKIRPFLQGFWHDSEDVQITIKAAENKNLDWIIWNNSSQYEVEYFTKIES